MKSGRAALTAARSSGLFGSAGVTTLMPCSAATAATLPNQMFSVGLS
jgi:hypothetical protein